jgi:hypothetical protein
MLPLSFSSVSHDDVEVVMGAFKLSLHFGKLMLDTIELYTCLLTVLLHSSDFIFFLTELQVNSLVLIGQLLGQSILKTSHQGLKVSNKEV